MKKIIVTVGMSNSGKSTWSRDLFDTNSDLYVIVNRDKIRELLFGYTEETIHSYYSRNDLSKREKQVTRYEDTLINEALESGKIPIVDATHLRREYLERFKYWNVEVELHWFTISLEEARHRNSFRKRKVDDKVLVKQLNQYVNIVKLHQENPIDFTPVKFHNDKEKPKCFVFDLDGTLAHMEGRSPYEWDKVGEDRADDSIATIAEALDITHGRTIICTGRDGSCTNQTKVWLQDNKIAYLRLYIREEGDMRPDWVVKEELLRSLSKDYYIAGVFEDRLQVVRRLRALGIKVLNVEYNNF